MQPQKAVDEQGSQDEINSLTPAIEFFIKYQLPWLGFSDNSNAEEGRYGGFDSHIASFDTTRGDPLARFLSGKRKFLQNSFDGITGLIKERERLKYAAFYQINQDVCDVRTKMLNLPKSGYALIPDMEKTYDALHRQVVALHKEKRAEEVSCWRDVSRLKSDLQESIKQLEQERRKQSVLTGRVKW